MRKGAAIYILVTILYHIIAGNLKHTQSTQINNIVGLVTNLKLLRTLKVINNEIYHRYLGIFTRCVIEYEGIGGTNEHPDGSLFNGSWFATGENYFISRVKRGVKALGDVLSKGRGMNYMHTISIYTLLGHNSFDKMMSMVFELEVCENSIEDFLLMLSCAKKLKNQIDNQDKRHQLQKLVDNGKQFDHAVEAKLNKLVSAHQKYIDYLREKRPIKTSVIGFRSL
jgi:hypothetical protein